MAGVNPSTWENENVAAVWLWLLQFVLQCYTKGWRIDLAIATASV